MIYLVMVLGILRENDFRVALVPDSLSSLKDLEIDVILEEGVGSDLGLDYGLKGITREKVLSKADILPTISPIPIKDILSTKNNATFISRFAPYDNPSIISSFQQGNRSTYSLDMIPRITIAQSCDVLSSLASLAGYKAVLLAAHHFNKYLPMLTTAAGTVAPAKVMVIGAGVAGLQAVATAKRLGAVVSAFDTRVAAKTDVMSLGAKFIEVEGAADDKSAGGYAVEQSQEYQLIQKKEIYKNIVKSDIIVTTAQIRGKPAPRLIDREMVAGMAPGSIIVDLASATGGNCELTEDGKTITTQGVTIIGDSDLSAQVPYHASVLYSRNTVNFLKFMVNNGKFDPLNREHEVVKASSIVYQGK